MRINKHYGLETWKNLLRYILKFDWYLICRWFRLWKQRQIRGWDDSETWSLDSTFTSFMLPRLKKYQEFSEEILADIDFLNELEKIIFALEVHDHQYDFDHPLHYNNLSKEDQDRVEEGFEALGRNFRRLWW